MLLKEKFIQELKLLIQRNDIKDEIKNLIQPIVDMFLIEIYPFIYISIIFVIISFLLILAIFVLLVRNNLIIK